MDSNKRRRAICALDTHEYVGKDGSRWHRVLTSPSRMHIGDVYGAKRTTWKAWAGGLWVGEFTTRREAIAEIIVRAKAELATLE